MNIRYPIYEGVYRILTADYVLLFGKVDFHCICEVVYGI